MDEFTKGIVPAWTAGLLFGTDLTRIFRLVREPMLRRSLPVFLLLLQLAGFALAGPIAPADIPDPLKPWSSWVLWNDKTQPCPVLAGTPDKRQCDWPASLQLALERLE